MCEVKQKHFVPKQQNYSWYYIVAETFSVINIVLIAQLVERQTEGCKLHAVTVHPSEGP